MNYRLSDRAVNVEQSRERLKNPPTLYRIALYLVFAEMALPFVAIAGFVFDREISNVLYGLGIDTAKISSLFFLQEQYEFFLKNKLNANLHLYDFHIFEVVGWLVVAIVAARLSAALLLVEYIDARLEFRALEISLSKFLFGWFLIGPLALYVSTDVSFGASSTFTRALMGFSPRTFLCVQAFVFCLASMFFCEGICFMLQLTVATWRRGRFVKSADS